MSLSPYVERIAEATQGIQAAKAAIASAITAKGGTVGTSDGLADFPAAIAGIPSGGGIVKTKIGTFYKDTQRPDIQENLAAIDLPAGLPFGILEFIPSDHTKKTSEILIYSNHQTSRSDNGLGFVNGVFYGMISYALLFQVSARESESDPIVIRYRKAGGGAYPQLHGTDIDVYAWTMPIGV